MKKKKLPGYYSPLAILLAVLLCAVRCDKESENCHPGITFVNNSGKTLYLAFTVEKNYDSGLIDPSLSPNYNKVESKSSNDIAWYKPGGCFESFFLREPTTDELWFVVFDEQVLKNNPWEEVVAQRMFLKEYRLTLEDLRKLDWKITYSGE